MIDRTLLLSNYLGNSFLQTEQPPKSEFPSHYSLVVVLHASTLSPACFHLDPSNLNVRPLLKRFPTELSAKFLLFLPCNIKFNRINFPFDGFSLSLPKYRLVVTNSPHRASAFKHFGEFIITFDIWIVTKETYSSRYTSTYIQNGFYALVIS